jgi:hypothetical protein
LPSQKLKPEEKIKKQDYPKKAEEKQIMLKEE